MTLNFYALNAATRREHDSHHYTLYGIELPLWSPDISCPSMMQIQHMFAHCISSWKPWMFESKQIFRSVETLIRYYNWYTVAYFMNLSQFVELRNLFLPWSSSAGNWLIRYQCVVGETGPAVFLHDGVEDLDGIMDPSLDIFVGVTSRAKISSAGRCIVFGTCISDVWEWIDKKLWQVILCVRFQIFQKQNIFTVIRFNLI